MKRERPPTSEEFQRLLAWLNTDPEQAGRHFNTIHGRLVKVFASRGCVDAEALADEVCNRIAVRIDAVTKNYTDPVRCCLGFVENVYREDRRDQQKLLNLREPVRPRPAEQLEREDECLKQCLGALSQPERELFVRYFQEEKRARIDNRKKLATELVWTANALRIRAHHLRKEIHYCIMTCLGET
jgi:hypothetical protein